jgi:predicted ester cyclase
MTDPIPDSTRALIDRYYSVFDAREGNLSDLQTVVSADWVNHGSAGADLSQASFSGLLTGIHQSVPDLTWRVVEIIVSGARVVVRGEGSGTPIAPLFGTPATGAGFSILSIDIHTLADGRIHESYHLEDWASALGQISAGQSGSILRSGAAAAPAAAAPDGTDGASTRWMLRVLPARTPPGLMAS